MADLLDLCFVAVICGCVSSRGSRSRSPVATFWLPLLLLCYSAPSRRIKTYCMERLLASSRTHTDAFCRFGGECVLVVCGGMDNNKRLLSRCRAERSEKKPCSKHTNTCDRMHEHTHTHTGMSAQHRFESVTFQCLDDDIIQSDEPMHFGSGVKLGAVARSNCGRADFE